MIEDKTAKEIDDSNLIKDKKRRKIWYSVVENCRDYYLLL
jgi:hypothetical protein